MNANALVGLVRSHMAYERDWPDVTEAGRREPDADQIAAPLRVFDLSSVLNEANEGMEVHIEWGKVGRNLPFPLFAVVGTGKGVFVVASDEQGLYGYCYTSPVPTVFVTFTETGWEYVGMNRENGDEPVRVNDERVNAFAEAMGQLLTLVERACDDTRSIVSYTLNRAERRSVSREVGSDRLKGAIVHHVCLDGRAKELLTAQRGATVVPTPKRLHEVRSHWRHLRSGAVTRVRSHRRGKRGHLAPRVYSIPAVPSEFGGVGGSGG